MRNKKRFIFFTLLYILVAGIGASTAFAEDSAETSTAPIGFTYRVVKPENQISTAGYFDLRMTPGTKQTVQIELANDNEEPLTVGVALNSAKTNSNGVVEYGPTSIENDASLKYDFVDVVKGPSEVEVPAKSIVPLELEITMPKEQFDGYISGGIQLTQLDTSGNKEEISGIVNKYAFMVGLLLSETDNVVQPDLSFNKAYAGLANYRNAVFINFSNTQAAYLENMTVNAQISKEGSDEVLYDTKKAAMRMAPNSMIDFPVEMNGDMMEAGMYQAHVVVTADERKWEWTETFEITNEEADKFNSQDVSLTQEQGIDWKLIALIVGGIFGLVIVIFIIVRMMNKKSKKNKKKVKSSAKKTAKKKPSKK